MINARTCTITVASALAAGLLLAGCNGTAKTHSAELDPGAAQASATRSGGSAAGAAVKPAASTNDSCALLTQAEVDTAVGQPLGAGKPVLPTGSCLWATSDFAAGVNITVANWTGLKAAAHGDGATPTSVSGVGEEALNLNSSNGSILYVRKGDGGFLITINGPHVDGLADHGFAQEKVLGTAAVGRL